jgi:hypothetical protein
MNKVMISKEEAAALESALEVNGGDKANVVHWHIQDLWDGKRAPLNELDLDTVCSALYVGYEIEAGPEEKVLELYESYNVGGGVRMIIKDVINRLNIQIKGINC